MDVEDDSVRRLAGRHVAEPATLVDQPEASDLIPEMCETSCSWSCQLSKGGPGPDIHLTMPLSLNIFFNHLYLIRQDGGGILDVKQLVDRHVQCRYDLLRVADELPVQVLVKRLYVAAVDVEEGVLQRCNLVQPLLVDWFVRVHSIPPLVLSRILVDEGVDKLLELGLALLDRHVRPPDDHGRGRLASLARRDSLGHRVDTARRGRNTVTTSGQGHLTETSFGLDVRPAQVVV